VARAHGDGGGLRKIGKQSGRERKPPTERWRRQKASSGVCRNTGCRTIWLPAWYSPMRLYVLPACGSGFTRSFAIICRRVEARVPFPSEPGWVLRTARNRYLAHVLQVHVGDRSGRPTLSQRVVQRACGDGPQAPEKILSQYPPISTKGVGGQGAAELWARLSPSRA
jgi:hypothetical protein